jgi:hypothetical protein
LRGEGEQQRQDGPNQNGRDRAQHAGLLLLLAPGNGVRAALEGGATTTLPYSTTPRRVRQVAAVSCYY